MTRSRPVDDDLVLDDELELDEDDADDAGEGFAPAELVRMLFSRRNLFLAGLFVAAVVAFLYVVLPQIPSLQKSIDQVRTEGDRGWLVAALFFEVLSYVGYIWLFRTVFGDKSPRIGWRGSTQISLAGVAATRMFGAAGAGGIALTFWAVRRAGMGRRQAVVRLVAFYVLTYSIFMGALVIDGILLRTGAVSGEAPFGFTVVPAIFGGVVYAIFFAALLVPGDMERFVERWSRGRGRVAAIATKLATGPALLGKGTQVAIDLIRQRRLGVFGAFMWWIFDIAVLWACFKAFGGEPTIAVLVMGYFVGMIAGTLPVPGGIGAVEGGMIGSFAAFGVPIGAATLAVLAYRIFAFWLPTVPGLVAYLRLRKTVDRWSQEDATIKSKVLPAS